MTFVVMRTNIRLAVFDLTGVVGDAYGVASFSALKHAITLNRCPPGGNFLRKTMGFDKIAQLDLYGNKFNVPKITQEKIYHSYVPAYRCYLEQIEPLKNIKDVFSSLRERNIKIGIYSSQEQSNLKVLLEKLNITPDISISTEQVRHPEDSLDKNLKAVAIGEIMSSMSVFDPRSIVNFGSTNHSMDAGKIVYTWNVGVPFFSPGILNAGHDTGVSIIPVLEPGKNNYISSKSFPDDVEHYISDIQRRLNDKRQSERFTGFYSEFH